MRSFASVMHYERRENDSNRLMMWFFERQEG
jgi:hypothetical protein